MGREWLHWIVGAGAGMPRRTRRTSAANKEDDTSSPGCMCAVFHLFDLHHIPIPLNHQHSLSPFLQEATSKGVEAPINSLELEAPRPPPIAVKQEENVNFPAGIQIKTRTSISASECSVESPAIKTPNLVARLMGLDLLHETTSPSSSTSTSKSHLKQTKTRSNRCFSDDDITVGARSLPETPRIEHHRLSLQIHKDNTNEEFAAKTTRTRFRQDENRSPRHYAKQIMKQVRESVSRRVGLLDITNANRDEARRDQNLELSDKDSPKLRNLDNKNNRPDAETSRSSTKSPRNSTSSDTYTAKPNHQQHQSKQIRREFKKSSPHNKATRRRKEDAYLRPAAAKRAPPSNGLLQLSGPTTIPVKKAPSAPATKLPQKQAQAASDSLSLKRNTQLSSNTSRSYKQLPLHPLKKFTVPENVTNGCATTTSAYKSYIDKILKRAGIINGLTPLTLGKWHTPSHPLDPSIFYHLELFHSATAAVLARRCNRKLIFQLVDELLVDILRPHLEYKPWVSPIVKKSNHFGLVDELCEKIESFPAADCRVLEDIDFLIDEDLRKSPLNGYFEEEGEMIVREIEGDILERLVWEMVAAGVRTSKNTRRQHVDQTG